MCGIAGLVDPSGRGATIVGAMLNTLSHRGPDGVGLWEGPEGITLGHRRLAIVDLSPAGHQPMQMGGLMLTYNGEIYNHSALRKALERDGNAPAWRGHSDTETLLACITVWGLDRTLERMDGMFAFALWDGYESPPLSGSRSNGRKAALLHLAGRPICFRFGARRPSLRYPGTDRGLIPRPRSAFCNKVTSREHRQSYEASIVCPQEPSSTLGIDQLRNAPPDDAIPSLQRRYWSLGTVVQRRSRVPATHARPFKHT